jgi:serine/threonine protein kinase
MDGFQTDERKDKDDFADRKIYGDYEIIRPIGKGKFAIVYRAKRLSDGETVALKRISVRQLHPYTQLPITSYNSHNIGGQYRRQGPREVSERSATVAVSRPPEYYPLPRLLHRRSRPHHHRRVGSSW